MRLVATLAALFLVPHAVASESDLPRRVTTLMQTAAVPGVSLAVIRDGRIGLHRGLGFSNATTRERVTERTVFEAASLSKPLFAYAVLRLVDAGVLSLDTPLSAYLPASAVDDSMKPITARMVLTHTTGLQNERMPGEALRVHFTPGDRFSYSGEGYAYLQRVVEHLTGKPLQLLIDELVLVPLEMRDSGFVWTPVYEQTKAYGHTAIGLVAERRKPAAATLPMLHVTAQDYARFVIAAMKGAGLEPSTARAMFTKQVSIDEDCFNCLDKPLGRASTTLGWGLGWALETTSRGHAFWHWGDNNGEFQSFVMAYPNGDGVVILTNSGNGLSIIPEIVASVLPGEHPAFAWIRYEPYTAPSPRFLRDVMARGAGQALTDERSSALTEQQLNRVGYLLLGAKRLDDALAVFQRAVQRFPQSFNAFDSLGEAYAVIGDRENAIANYQRSLSLNAANANADRMIRKLREESGARTEIAKILTLQIDADARPGVGQFVPADDGVQHLVYELFVNNYDRDLRFAAVDVEDAATGQRLARFDSKALSDPIRLRTPGKDRLLPRWRTAILTMDVKLPLDASLPAAVRHRIQFEPDPNLQMIQDDGSLSSELVSFSEPLPINRARPLVIGPPLRGGPWLCGNGLGHGNNHEYIGAHNKKARLHVAQRFGCDFGKLNAKGNRLPGPVAGLVSASMYYSYGADVIAVANGRVVDLVDGVPENIPQPEYAFIPPVPLTDRTYPGNMISLQIGEGQYAHYAHLQPGSLRVKVGDRVRKGQLLGKVGNSGNAAGPHLHFQVSSGPELNSSDFVPHVYRSYWLSGHGRLNPTRRRKVEFQVPTSGSIMTFPGPGISSPDVATNYSFRDSVSRQYPLERSPRIEIKSIGGSVVISSGPAGMADVEAQRSAPTQRELDCREVKIDHRPDLITITAVQLTDRPGCAAIWSAQALTLRVPSDALLRLSDIDGELQVTGPVGGIVAEDIGGHVSIAEAGTVDLRSLSNGVSLRLGAASPGSVNIRSVFGDVELDVAERRDVEIRVTSVIAGEVRSVPRGFVRVKTDDGYLLKSGEGGPSLSISDIDGDIVVFTPPASSPRPPAPRARLP